MNEQSLTLNRPANPCPDNPPDPDGWIDAVSAWLRLTVSHLVDEGPVECMTLVGSGSVIFEVKVPPPEVRRVIGRKGRTADALRELLTNFAGKANRRFLLEILEPHQPIHADPADPDLLDDAEAFAGVEVIRVNGGRLSADRRG